MDGYNVKNYTEPGGDVTHIGGRLIFEEGASVEGLPAAENQPDSTAMTVAALGPCFRPIRSCSCRNTER